MLRIPLQQLEIDRVRLLKGRHQPNTRKTYGGEIGIYLRVCELYGWDVYPKPYRLKTMEHQISLYLTYLVSTGDNGHSSLNSHVYAIKSFMLERYGINMRTKREDMPVVKGIVTKRKKDKPSVNTRHIDKEMLEILFGRLDGRDMSDATYRFMFALAHNTMRRPSEVLEADGLTSQVRHIRFGNGTVRPSPGGRDIHAVFGLSKSKCNKYGRDQNVVMTCICPSVCALCELRNMYRRRKRLGWWKKKDLLLVISVKGIWRTPTYDNWRNKLEWLLKESGFDGKGWTLHGCRGGGQGDARERGLSLHSIMQQAGWKTVETAIRYDHQLEERKKVKRILDEQEMKRRESINE